MSVKISSLNTASTINSGDDINIAGNNPLTFSDWGGGWFMQDGTWIRSYNNKSLWMGAGYIGGDGGLTIGYGGTSYGTNNAIIAGSVGIGTSSPTRKFVVTGAANSEWIATFTNTGTNPYGVYIDTSANSGAAYSFATYTNAGTGFFVLNNGNVLIGTTTDVGSKLYVDGTIRTSGAFVGGGILEFTGGWSASPYNSSSWVRAASGTGLFLVNNGITKWAGFKPNDDFVVNNADLYISASTGNVGIGMTPYTKFDVNGVVNASSTSGFALGITAILPNGAGGFYHTNGATTGYVHYYSNLGGLRLGVEGNSNALDIVKTTGAATFSSSVTANGDLYLQNSARAIVFNSNTNNNTQIYEVAGKIVLYTGAVDRLTIASNGIATFASSVIISTANNINPADNVNTVVVGNVGDSGWRAKGIGGSAAANHNWTIAHNALNLYFGISNGVTASLASWLVVSPSGVVVFNSLAGTGSRMVVANASGELSTQTIPSGVSGSGTTDYLPKWTGASDLGNSAFYDGGGFGGFNSTGLGSRTFVINAANARPLVLEMIEYANVHAVYVRPNNSSYNLISSNYISGGVYLPLALSGRENNTDLVLTTSGNVEIGNSAVANLYKLDVNGTARFSGDITISGQRIKELTSTNKGIYIGNWGGAGYWGLGSTATSHELKLDQVNQSTGAWEGATDVNLYLGSNRLVIHSGNFNSYAPTLTGTGASGTWGISVTGSSSSAATAGYTTNTSGGAIRSYDLRTIAPDSMTAYRMGFGFTSFNNNNTAPWADYLHLRSYSDSSGGADNLVVFNRSTIGMRIYQQTWGSSTAYSSYKDIAFTDGTNSSGTWGISVTGNAGTATSAGSSAYSTNLSNQWINNGTTFISTYNSLGNSRASFDFIYNTSDMPLAGGLYSVIMNKSDASYGAMIALNTEPNTGTLYTKVKYGGSWYGWKTILDEGNIGGYAVRAYYVTDIPMTQTGNWTAMSTSTGISGWTHVLNMAWASTDQSNWVSQIAFATQTGTGAYYRTKSVGTLSAAWTRFIDELTIGSQSVSYATTAGALTSMLISQFTNDSAYITSASLAGYAPLDGTGATGLWNINISGISDLTAGIQAYFLGTNSVNVNTATTSVYRNENGAGAVLSYAPVLHVAASDTMWQLQGTYGTTGNGTLYFRQGYNGSWGTWLTMISSANISSYLSGTYLPLTGGTLTGTLNGTRAVFSTAINNDYGLSVTNTGTTGAGGLYVNIGTSATGAPIRVDKAGSAIFLMSSTGNITMAGDLAVNGGDIIISSSGGANVFTRYQNGTGNVEWRLAASVFTLVDNVNEISLMEINPTTAGTFLYYPSLTINTSNTSGGVLLFKATLAANTWGIYKNDTTGLTITKNSVTQLGISATGAITLINTLSVTGGYIEVGEYGLSSSTYSAYIKRNDASSYGAWDITGGKGGYTGALYNTTNQPHIMFGTTNGFGGLYYQTGSRWVLYYNYTDNCLAVGGTTTNATYKMYVTGAIYATGAIVANSDGRNKENIEVVENALEKVTNLRGVTYTKKDQDSGKREMGVIAQEVEPHVPEVVHYSKDADIYGVSYGNFAGLFIEAIKEQQVVINELKAEIEILKNK